LRRFISVRGRAANARVAQTSFQQATTPGNNAATIFWLKARAGWREKQPTPASDQPGGPPAQVVVIRKMFDPTGCTRTATELSPPLIEGDASDQQQ
jgi:hypothetical protein